MKRLIGMLLLLSLAWTPMLQAGLFGESEAEKEARIAKHVADLLREPNRVIAEAQFAVESNDIEEGIRLFRKAQTMLEEIEDSEDTSGSAFATLRLKKFHCVSMLDALVLKQSEVNDVRQAVTDTSELTKRLAQERAELARQAEAEKNQNDLPRPPTLADQLAVEEGKLMVARTALENVQALAQKAKQDADASQKAFAEAARLHTEADTRCFMADQMLKKAEKDGKPKAELEQLAKDFEATRVALEEAKSALQAAKERQQPTQQVLEEANLKVAEAKQTVDVAERAVEVLRKALADEAEAKRKQLAAEKARAEAEKQRLAAERLKQKQAEAEAAKRAKEQAEKAAAERDAALKAKAKAEAEELQKTLQICEELWRMKRVEAFEEKVTEALEKWPDSGELMVQLARLRLIQGEEEDALELVAMTSNKGEVGKRAAFVAAGAYMVKGQPLEAMKMLEPLEKAFPKDPDVYYNMAVILVRLPEVDPNRDLAARYYTRSIELGGCRSSVLERRLDME